MFKVIAALLCPSRSETVTDRPARISTEAKKCRKSWHPASVTPAAVLAGTLQDVAGCTKTFTIVNANAFAVCFGTFDSSNTVTASSNVAVGSPVVDGVVQTGEAHWDDRVQRVTAYQSSTVTGPAAGSHT